MIERHADQIQLICDETGKHSTFYRVSEFDAMVSDARARGWRIFKKHGEYVRLHPSADDASEEFGVVNID